MPTKRKRYSLSLPPELQQMLEKEAEFNQRAVANQILFILDRWFFDKKKELDYFRPTRLSGEEIPEAQVFESPARRHAEHVSKFRDALDQEKS